MRDDVAGRNIAKRALDVSVASLALIVVSPILLATAIAIKSTSTGPVFFLQDRYGRDMRRFRCLKFRTMTVLEQGDAFVQARKGDARVTRVGSFLRRTSIDELPQLLNVVAGSMSLVGPRPHPTKLDDVFAPKIPGYESRFAALPGITGLAQIRGHRGPTPDVETMAARIASDVEYVRTRSIVLDLKILLRTVPAMLAGTNAH